MICIQTTLLFHSNEADPHFNWWFVSHLCMTNHVMNSQSMQKTDGASSIQPAEEQCSALLHYSYKQLVEVIMFQTAQGKY